MQEEERKEHLHHHPHSPPPGVFIISQEQNLEMAFSLASSQIYFLLLSLSFPSNQNPSSLILQAIQMDISSQRVWFTK